MLPIWLLACLLVLHVSHDDRLRCLFLDHSSVHRQGQAAPRMVVRTTTPTITPAVPVKPATAPAPEPEAAEPGFSSRTTFNLSYHSKETVDP